MIFAKFSQNLIKSPLNLGFISQISVHSLWHVWDLDITQSCCGSIFFPWNFTKELLENDHYPIIFL